ncbi:MAG: ABC transporter ATP-binding protein [Candidatus Margulisbacteria bacterium]|nr:ABC transporter ATP-binding protein [Candidatus Margulisiibacteriota bacterium]MBU1022038.1 ABC transporter ATP-binding protein [Candidatus Margulisiibacteriota bacterium]MBU1729633.1 ABC transporter ATP-binding protein [Candidatus Margulisiibacteriota bacterium]MBU1954953.1 ABC transporter ATP-binding protein [Candidatus Margulisiibacteriota bacterium]
MSVYKLEKIKRSYDNNDILDNVNLTFEDGKIYCLVGEIGCGKTTLLNTLAFLDAPQGGNLFFNNLPSRRKNISYCMQQPFLFKTTVFNNIAYGLKARRENKVNEKVNNISRLFGIDPLLDQKVSRLSGGQTQKVALARTFILDTPVLLLDEPTANLDEASIQLLEGALSQSRKKGNTIIFATHQLDIAYRLADEVITIHDRQVFPQSYQNFFAGEIISSNGLKSFKINDQIAFILAIDKEGQAKASIDPKEIIISKEKFTSSARNSLPGKVISIIDEGKIVKLTADCGIKLVSQITHKSLDELGINVGQNVFLTFKTSSIKVY